MREPNHLEERSASTSSDVHVVADSAEDSVPHGAAPQAGGGGLHM